MKKLLLLSFVLLLSIQVFSQKRKTFGINAGVTYSKFRGMDVPLVKYDFDYGYVVGISYEYYFKDNLAIKMNLSYDRKVSKGSVDVELRESLDDPARLVDVTFNFNYNYLTLPVLLKYEFKNSHGIFINGGPFFGYLMDSEFVGEAIDGIQSEGYRESTTNLNNQFDFGFTTGIGKTFQLKNKNSLVVEFRNNLGLSKTNKDNTFDENTVRSNSYNLLVGWAFDL